MSRAPLQIGQTFNCLTVIGVGDRNSNGHLVCRIQCSCGEIKVLRETAVKRGEIKSCGHLIADATRLRVRLGTHKPCLKHGLRNTPEYHIFISARQRCTNPNNQSYPSYGGRGIQFKFESVDAFIAEIGKRPSRNHSVDRINNDGHYEPGNVRWATAKQQANNRRSLTAHG